MKQIYYRVIYGSDKSNDNTWHYETCKDLQSIKPLIEWCIEKNLIIIEIKALYR